MSISYGQSHEFVARLSGQNVLFISKPGLPQWDRVTPSARLLAEHVSLPARGRLLWLGCGHGAAAVSLARRFPDGEFWLSDLNFIALEMAARTLAANQLTYARIHPHLSVLPDQQEAFEVCVIDLPKGRKLAQRWLAEAWYALKPGGYLYLAGSNNQGVQSLIKDALLLFGESTILAYKQGNRIARLAKVKSQPPDIPWLQAPGILPGTWVEFDLPTSQGRLHLYSLPGIFSYDRLDEGTSLLLETMMISPGDHVLDLGCGYGILGLLASQAGAGHIHLVDVSLLSVAAAQKNLETLNIANARVYPSDALSAVAGQQYHLILSNPPFHTGKDVDYQVAQAFIQQSWYSLLPGGRLILVANKFIRYDQLMFGIFPQVTRLAETGKYQILSGQK